MVDYPAGTASITMKASFRDFVKDSKAELKAMDLTAAVRLQANLAEADARLKEWRENASRDLGINAKADTSRADATLARWRTEQEANPLRFRVDVDRSSSGSAKSAVGKLAKDAREAGALNLKIIGVDGAAAAVSQLLSVAQAAAQVSHTIALIPAVGLAGLAGVGSAAVGINGLPAAFKAMSAASKDSTDSANKQRDALDAVGEAQYRIGEAQSAVQTANREAIQDQKDLALAYEDSSRSLRDMNLSLEEQKLNVADAAIAVREAAKKLQEVQHSPTSDADARKKADDDYQRAVIRLQEQQNKQQDLNKDTAKANADGIEGSKKVVEAKQKVADSVQGEAKAAHELQQSYVGLRKAQDALKASGGQGKIDAALAQLSPNARELVNDIHTLGSAWTDVRKSGQDALTYGLGPAVTHLADVQLPNLKSGIVGIDAALNTGLRASIAQLSSGTSQREFKTFLDNTSTAFGNLAKGSAPLTAALEQLATTGSGFLPQFGQSAANAEEKFNALIQRTAATGQLQTWIQGGLTSGKELGQVFEHVGSGIASVLHAAGDGGVGLKSLDDLTKRWATFLSSAKGQTELGDWFARARAEADKFTPILKDIPGVLSGAAEGVRAWSAVTLPFLRLAADLLAKHKFLVEAAVLAYVGFKTVKPVIDGAELAIKTLGQTAAGQAATEGGLGKFRAAGAGALGILGNPWTIGLAVAGGAVLGFMSSVDRSASAVQRYRDQAAEAIEAAQGVQKALTSSGGSVDTGVIDRETQSIAQWRAQLKINAEDAPGFMDKIQEGLVLMATEYSRHGGVSGHESSPWAQRIIDNDDMRDSTSRMSAAVKKSLDDLGLSDDQLAKIITGNEGDFEAWQQRLRLAGGAGGDAAVKLQSLRDEFGRQQAASHPVADAFKDIGDNAQTAADKIGGLTTAMDTQWRKQNEITDSKLLAAQALSRLTEGIGHPTKAPTTLPDGTVQPGEVSTLPTILPDGSVDLSTASGQALQQNLEGLQKGYDNAATSAAVLAAQAGKTRDEQVKAAQDAGNAYLDKAKRELEAAGLPVPAVDNLFQHEMRIPPTVSTEFLAHTDQAMTDLQKLQNQIDSFKGTVTGIPFVLQWKSSLQDPNDTARHPQFAPSPTPNSLGDFMMPHAAGGAITGGVKGRDSVPAWLMPEEHVLTTSDVDKLGGQAGAYRFRAALQRGEVSKFAVGGTADTASAAARAQALEQFAQSRSGQPYGDAEDCSGFVSELANEAAGLAPNSGRMSTANEGEWLTALGWKLGDGPLGSFRVGWINDPSMPAGGHTAGTLPNEVNVESGGATSQVMYGGQAIGAGNAMFNRHAYLDMSVAAPGIAPGASGGATATTQSVVNPQAPQPGRRTDEQISVLTDRAAVDDANSARNAVYADPKSTAQDKLAADLKYQQAQNALEKATSNTDQSAISLQGFATKAAGILATGFLSAFGLENSIFSDTNVYNKAANDTITGLQQHGIGGPLGGYAYQPQNLPSIVTTSTPQTGSAPAGTTAVPADPNAASGTPQAIAKRAFHPYGWDVGVEWDATNQLVTHEDSTWDPTAQNPNSTARGTFQFLDSTWATVGATKTDDPYQQAVAGAAYIKQRYGDPVGAWNFWENIAPTIAVGDPPITGAHWYDQGGEASGKGFLMKNVIKPERVLNPSNTETFNSVLPLLESINATAWADPSCITVPMSPSTQANQRSSGHDLSTHIYEPRVADLRDLVDLAERASQRRAIGMMSALP